MPQKSMRMSLIEDEVSFSKYKRHEYDRDSTDYTHISYAVFSTNVALRTCARTS